MRQRVVTQLCFCFCASFMRMFLRNCAASCLQEEQIPTNKGSFTQYCKISILWIKADTVPFSQIDIDKYLHWDKHKWLSLYMFLNQKIHRHEGRKTKCKIPKFLIDNGSNSTLCHIKNSSCLSMVEFVWHSFLESTISLFKWIRMSMT